MKIKAQKSQMLTINPYPIAPATAQITVPRKPAWPNDAPHAATSPDKAPESIKPAMCFQYSPTNG